MRFDVYSVSTEKKMVTAQSSEMQGYYRWKQSNPILVWRVRKGLSRLDLSVMVGVAQSTIALWENGASNPSPDKFDSLARVMGKTESDLRSEYWTWQSKVGESVNDQDR